MIYSPELPGAFLPPRWRHELAKARFRLRRPGRPERSPASKRRKNRTRTREKTFAVFRAATWKTIFRCARLREQSARQFHAPGGMARRDERDNAQLLWRATQ